MEWFTYLESQIANAYELHCYSV